MNLKLIRLFLVLIVMLWASTQKMSFAQDGNTIYFMQNIPQSNYSNPALIPNCKFYLGIPGISSVRFNLDNGSFSYNDVFTRRADDSLIIDKDKLLGALSDKNKLSYDISEQIFGMGFRVRKSYFSLGVNYKFSTNFNYSKDFMIFLLKGNSEFLGKNADFSDTKVETNAYSEIALGFSREIGKKITVGVKAKYLIGLINVYTEKSNIKIYTDPNTYDLTATTDMLIHSSSPLDSLKNFDKQFKDVKWKNLMDNNGIAFDFGATYQLNKRWAFGASLIDLGSINWKTNIKDYRTKNPNKSFTFSGLDINEAFKGGNLDNKVIDNLVDSLKETIGIEDVSGTSYKAPLKTKLYLSASFALNSKNRFGLLMRNEFANEDVNTMLSVSYNTNIGRNFAITLSNTFVAGNLFNPGGGFTFNFGPIQFYLIGDHFSSVYAADMKNMGVHFGLNFIFGKTKQGYRYEKQKNIVVEEERTKKKRYPVILSDTVLTKDTLVLPVKDTVVAKTDTNASVFIKDTSFVKPVDTLIKAADTVVIENLPVVKDSIEVLQKETTLPIIKKEEIVPQKPVIKPAAKKAVVPKKPAPTTTKKPAANLPKPTIKPVQKPKK